MSSTCATETPNPPEPSFRVEVGDPEVVATAVQRRASGLDFWVDGTMGIHRSADRTLVLAPNGPRLARHVLPPGADLADGLLGGRSDPSAVIEGLPDDVVHASGGPLFVDPTTGALVLVYHGETFRGGDDQDYYSFIGMAVSDDTGATFEDLGRIVTSELEEHDVARPRPVDLGSGAFAVIDGWFHVYFQDRGIAEMRRNLSVARAAVTDVVGDALARTPPQFHKSFRGEFTEPGLGGRSDELLSPTRCWMAWFDTIQLDQLGCIGLVASRFVGTSPSNPLWTQQLFTSEDGLEWRGPFELGGTPQPAEMLYVSLDSGGPDSRRSADGSFDLYRTRSTTPFRWDDAQLERVRVKVTAGSVVADG